MLSSLRAGAALLLEVVYWPGSGLREDKTACEVLPARDIL